MTYVVIFVAAVPTGNKQSYAQFAEAADECFMDNGALGIVECWGNDVPDGTMTSFIKSVQCREDETVVCGWVTWPSKAIRDEAMPKVMADPRMQHDMPFDGKRMIFGGFETLFQK